MTLSKLVLSSLSVALLSTAALAVESSPSDRTDDVIKNFRGVKSGTHSPAKEQVVDQLDSSFDFDTITTALMAPRVDKFKPDEQVAFKKKFHALIRTSAFVDTGDFFKTATLERKPALEAGQTTTVPVHVTRVSDDTDMEIGLQWKNEGGQLKIVDILLDGDSMISDYRNRITSIVDKKGVSGLFATLDEKLSKADKAKAK